MPCRHGFQRTGGWCEPGSGGLAAGAGAGSPNKAISVGDHGGPRYRRQRLVGALMRGVFGHNPGGTAVSFYRPRSERSLLGRLFLPAPVQQNHQPPPGAGKGAEKP